MGNSTRAGATTYTPVAGRVPALSGGSLPDYWSIPADRVVSALRSAAGGLDAAEARRRLAVHGANVPTPARASTGPRALMSQFISPITLLLLLAAGLSVAVGDRADGSIILGALLASALLGFWQEHRARIAVASLLAFVRTKVRVSRDGHETEIPIEEVVPGDIVHLAAGSSVPGDGRLLEARDLFIDESALTGESLPAEKIPGESTRDSALPQRRNCVFLGTHVVSGTATVVIARTGGMTEFATIARRLVLRPPETAFEHGVRQFGYLLLEITSVLAVGIFAINVALDRPVLEALLFTLALAVGLTPQLLPAIVSVTLARGAQQMARHKVIVRRLAAIEDLGGMEILCTDKTGTITEGAVAIHEAEGVDGQPNDRVRLLAYLNAAFETGFPNPIDDALRATRPAGAAAFTKVDEIPYDFTRKRLSVAVADAAGNRMIITKGSLPAVLDACSRVDTGTGPPPPLAHFRAAIEARHAALSAEGYRCLGVAWRTLDTALPVGRADERDLVFAGILTLADPIKPDAADALRDLASLGVSAKLVTGDNRLVAARLAGEAGLDATTVLTGAEIHHLTDDALRAAAIRVAVFAEVEPHQKERIILALKKTGRSVGYLGDGINDAAALHAADVGISVDTAADVTRQAADIVLLDKDLGALARGVREGRRAFANTLKYVFITTSANFGNMFSMAVASLMVPFLPLLPKQILLTNVLTDLPAMTIATDRLDPELVARPRRWDNRGIRRFMLVFGLVSSFFDFLTFASLVALRVPQAAFRSAWFIESVWSELLILLVIRTRRPFFRSRVGAGLGWSSLGVGLGTVILPYTPAAEPLGLAPLSPPTVALVAAIVAMYAATSEATKRVFYRRGGTEAGAR